MSDSTQLPLRSQVPVEQTWNLETIFATLPEWEQAYQEVGAALPSIQAFKGRLAEGPQTIVECMRTIEKVFRLAGKVMVYASLQTSADSTDQPALARAGQAGALFSRAAAAASFVDPELMAIGFSQLHQWADGHAEMGYLKYYLNKLEQKQAHVRSSDVEEVMAMAGDPLGTATNTYSLLTNADMKFTPAADAQGQAHEVGQSSIGALVAHTDRQVRKTAWESYADGYLAFKNTLASTQMGAVKRDVFNMRTRGYKSSLEASLKPNNIPVEVFHNLIAVFKKNLPTWHKYWRIRRKALSLDSFHVYDIKAPLTTGKVDVSFKQAVDWICDGMEPLGEDYVSAMRSGCLEERWVDWALNKGKRQGAFSSGMYDTNPFIMMSYSDDLYSLSTLAHELGHSMHSYYSKKAQPFIYARYSLFVAEVASNFNQAMVRDYLFKTQPDRDFQIALIEEAMSNYHRYFFIMPTLARYELELHERVERGAPVNADGLIKLTADLFKEGYGDEVVFDHDRIGITWAQFSHMYMNFYVYQYATGISGAHALADGVLHGQNGAASRYLDFLKSGGSVDPLDALKLAGVDMTSPEPVEKAFAVLAGLVDRLEELVG